MNNSFSALAAVFCSICAALCIGMAIIAHRAGSSPDVQIIAALVCGAMALVNLSRLRA